MKNNSLITMVVILAVIILAIIIIISSGNPNSNPNGNNSSLEETAKCIGEKATLYVQLGCHACENQEKMFGEYVQYLIIIDCWYEKEKCVGITATPTWVINGEQYKGVQSIEKLKELTGCENV